jgi:hypothetical protein
MKAFLERNKPVFLIGLATLLLFLGIIVAYALKTHKSVGLTKIGNESPFNVDETTSDIQGGVPSTSESTSSLANIDSTMGTVNISFNSYGWYPALVDAVKGQKVVWTNKTDKIIYLRQRTPTYPELTNLTAVDPGKTFEFRMMVDGNWNYDEDETKYFGTVRVFEIKQ